VSPQKIPEIPQDKVSSIQSLKATVSNFVSNESLPAKLKAVAKTNTKDNIWRIC